MKTNKLYLSALIFSMVVLKSIAQAPSAIPYQAVARDSSGNTIANQMISLRFSLHDSTPAGTILYQETQSAMTNLLGLLYADIGRGTPVIGTLDSVSNWGDNPIWFQVEMDVTGGISYSDMGTQQLLSVPYALYANVSGTAADSVWIVSGTDIYNSNTGKVGIGTDTPGSKFSVKGNMSIGDSVADKTSPPNGLNIEGGIMVGFTDNYDSTKLSQWIVITNNGKLGKHIGGVKYEDISYSSERSTGFEAIIEASDSVTGSKMNLKGGSDSASVYGDRMVVSGSGKEFIGSSRLMEEEGIYYYFAVGSEIRLNASDSVIGSNMNLKGGSDSTIIIGNRTVGNGRGKEFKGIVTATISGLENLDLNNNNFTIRHSTGMEMSLAGRETVTGSNMNLKGSSDSTVAIGNNITGTGKGKKFIGNVVTTKPWSPYDTGPTIWYNLAIGSNINITANDSVTGSRIVVNNGSDTTKVVGLEISNQGQDGSTAQWPLLNKIAVTDNAWKTTIGSDLIATAPISVTGNRLQLRGASDSAKINGLVIIPEGTGDLLTGTYIANWYIGDTETHEIGHWMGSKAVGTDIRLTASDSVTGSNVMLRGGSASAVVIGTDIHVDGGSNNIGLRSVTDGNGTAAIFSGTGGANGLLVPNGNVGLGTDSPNTTLDINGSLAIREIEVQITNAQNNDVTWVENGEGAIVMTGWGTEFSLSGIIFGDIAGRVLPNERTHRRYTKNGRILILYNHTGQPWNLQNENSGSSPENRILTLTGSDLHSEGNSVVILQYSWLDDRWVVLSHSNFVDGSLQMAIDAEAAARVAADSILHAIIRAEDIDHGQTFQAAIDAETAARVSSDSILQANISATDYDTQQGLNFIIAETHAREAGDSLETAARAVADSALQAAIIQEALLRSLDGGKTWKITGNSGTNPDSNFIGTTDNNPFIIKTNSTEAIRIISNGNVGIGTSTPAAPLSIKADTNGSLISLISNDGSRKWTVRSIDATDDRSIEVGFLYTSTGTPVSRLSIHDSTGFVGIGNPAPAFKLDVSGDINTSGGGGSGTSGYMIDGGAPSGQYLRGDGTRFTASPLLANDIAGQLPVFSIPNLSGDVSGNISNVSVVKLQGVPVSTTAPADGQVLTYDAVANEWQAREGMRNQNIYLAVGGSALTVTPATTNYVILPGMQLSITVHDNQAIKISSDGGVQCNGGAPTSVSVVDVALFVDGSIVTDAGLRRIVAANLASFQPMVNNWSLGLMQSLSTGSHTIDLRVKNGTGGTSNAAVSGDTNSVLQGQLTVTIINK